MGTDIHGVWQARKDGKWVDVPSEYEQDRHYFLFAVLGNVRNGFGFAGVKTFESINPLSDCRGLPDDFEMVDDEHPVLSLEHMDKRRQKWHEEDDGMSIWMGDHSFSWVTGEEIDSLDLPPTKRVGIVTKSFFESWDGKTAPESYCGGVSGPEILVSDPGNICEVTSHVRIEWVEDSMEAISYFTEEAKRLISTHGEIRFVFGFDS